VAGGDLGPASPKDGHLVAEADDATRPGIINQGQVIQVLSRLRGGSRSRNGRNSGGGAGDQCKGENQGSCYEIETV